MDGPRSGLNWTAIGVGLSFLMSVFTAAIVFGEMRGQVSNHTDDIKQLQADGRTINAALSKIEMTVTRIETKLSILLPDNVAMAKDGRR